MTGVVRSRHSSRGAGRAAGAAGLVLLAAGLSGCGFTPLYATPGMSPALASVDVETPQTRTGFLLRQQLNDQLARDTDLPARYHLATVLREYRYPRGVLVNNIASLYEIGAVVDYSLSDKVTGKVLLQGRAPVEVSYDSSTPPYAGTAANEDGQVRLAEQAAIRIRLDLSRYFENQARPPAAGAALTSGNSTSQPIAIPQQRTRNGAGDGPLIPQ